MSMIYDHRPTTFEEVWGNETTKKAIAGFLERSWEDIPKAFLFHGPRGCGKTTLARIIKKQLGCGDNDYTEIDTAQLRGVDTARGIRQNMMYSPSQGPCRIWLLDECHQLTKDAQDGLLKALEEPPAHVFFIMATTVPETLRDTFKDRCTVLKIEPLSFHQCVKFVKKMARKEGITLSKEHCEKIAEVSEGRPRSALQALDSVVSLSEEEREQALQNLNEAEVETKELCQKLIKKATWKDIMNTVSGLKKKGEEAEGTRRRIIGYASAVLESKEDPHAYLVLDSFLQAPVWAVGWPAIIGACWEAIKGE